MAVILVVICVVAVPMMVMGERNSARLPKQVYDVQSSYCPFDGNPAKSDIVGMNGNRIYHFCSSHCEKEFEKNPRVVANKLRNAPSVKLNVTNPDGTDPVSGNKIAGRSPKSLQIKGDSVTFFESPDNIQKAAVKRSSDDAASSHQGHSASAGVTDAHSGHNVGTNVSPSNPSSGGSQSSGHDGHSMPMDSGGGCGGGCGH